MYSRGSRSSNYEYRNKCLYTEFKVMPGAKAQHAAVGLICCRASGLSPGEDPTHPLVQPGCVFLKANFAPTPPQIPTCFHLRSCLPTSLRNPTFHLRTYLGSQSILATMCM